MLRAGYGVPADLDVVCAQRPRRSAVGAEEGCGAVEQRKMREEMFLISARRQLRDGYCSRNRSSWRGSWSGSGAIDW